MELLIIIMWRVHGQLRGDGPHVIEAAPALLDSALNQRTHHTANATLAELLHRENCARHFAAGLVEVVRGTRNRREPGWSITQADRRDERRGLRPVARGRWQRRSRPKMSAAGRRAARASGSARPLAASVWWCFVVY